MLQVAGEPAGRVVRVEQQVRRPARRARRRRRTRVRRCGGRRWRRRGPHRRLGRTATSPPGPSAPTGRGSVQVLDASVTATWSGVAAAWRRTAAGTEPCQVPIERAPTGRAAPRPPRRVTNEYALTGRSGSSATASRSCDVLVEELPHPVGPVEHAVVDEEQVEPVVVGHVQRDVELRADVGLGRAPRGRRPPAPPSWASTSMFIMLKKTWNSGVRLRSRGGCSSARSCSNETSWLSKAPRLTSRTRSTRWRRWGRRRDPSATRAC